MAEYLNMEKYNSSPLEDIPEPDPSKCEHEFESSNESNCCGATIPDYPDMDICGECHEHCEPTSYCAKCGIAEEDAKDKDDYMHTEAMNDIEQINKAFPLGEQE
jgi:hypothetical protein